MHAEPAPTGAAPALLKVIFLLVAALVLAAGGYAGWIMVRYWDQVGV